MFKCSNGQCIPFWWKCDGTPDCTDESDEVECPADGSGGSRPVTERPNINGPGDTTPAMHGRKKQF